MKSGSQCQTAYHLLHFAMHVPRFRRKYGGAHMYILDPVIRNPSSDKVKTYWRVHLITECALWLCLTHDLVQLCDWCVKLHHKCNQEGEVASTDRLVLINKINVLKRVLLVPCDHDHPETDDWHHKSTSQDIQKIKKLKLWHLDKYSVDISLNRKSDIKINVNYFSVFFVGSTGVHLK